MVRTRDLLSDGRVRGSGVGLAAGEGVYSGGGGRIFFLPGDLHLGGWGWGAGQGEVKKSGRLGSS